MSVCGGASLFTTDGTYPKPSEWSTLLTLKSRGSFGHGVPPQIAKNQYDVPLPTVDMLVPRSGRTTERVWAAHCHIALCQLTEILGELLPLVYGLQQKTARETTKKLRQIRTDLDLWEDGLPDWLKASALTSVARTWGASSLHLGFLALRMLISRVELNVRLISLFRHTFMKLMAFLQEVNNADADNPEARRYFQTECRRSAEQIVQFISSLRKQNYMEFWLPCMLSDLVSMFPFTPQITNGLPDSAFHLTSTATLLVRCALETNDAEVAQSCLGHVETLRSVLKKVRDEEDWDVADMCLDHCERILSRLPSRPGSVGETARGTFVDDPRLVNPGAISLPETQTNNDIVDDMMSISGTFGTMDGFPFDMTGIWDVSVFQDINLT